MGKALAGKTKTPPGNQHPKRHRTRGADTEPAAGGGTGTGGADGWAPPPLRKGGEIRAISGVPFDCFLLRAENDARELVLTEPGWRGGEEGASSWLRAAPEGFWG